MVFQSMDGIAIYIAAIYGGRLQCYDIITEVSALVSASTYYIATPFNFYSH